MRKPTIGNSSIPVNVTLKNNQNATFFNTLPETVTVENLQHVLSSIFILKKETQTLPMTGLSKHFTRMISKTSTQKIKM